VEGPHDPRAGHRFDATTILLDPYARAIGGREVWGQPPQRGGMSAQRARLPYEDFDWETDRPLERPLEELVIYELHVRGFTQHPSSAVKHAGTFAGLREKIPYLKELGVNCVELLPIFEFDEYENTRRNPDTGERLWQYWGYSTVGFFAPKAGFAAMGKLGMQVDELKALVKDLHAQGIEVFLDVVFNHTAEGGEEGPMISFRGIDNRTYYMLTPGGHYLDFTGTGNTLNCNHPVVRELVLDCLRYWAAEYHIDGFRFDLASVLGRDPWGTPLANPPLLEALAFDPILAKCKLIAEAWDAGGLYQVGTFPAYGRWAEWNGKYRDTLRKFLKGDMGQAGDLAQRLQGSPDLYTGRGTAASINFITCHEGFTLADLVSYNEKHNEANGEDNRDVATENLSWNCGVEGPTADPAILTLRRRQMKNAVAMLMVSRGVPMLLMGDEMGRSQGGNNNAYCQDTAWNWLDWTLLEANADLYRFVKACIGFRHAHPVLRSRKHPTQQDEAGSGLADTSWHGTQAWRADWTPASRTLAFLLDGPHAPGPAGDESIYVAMNMYWEALEFELPALADGRAWHVFANTSAPSPDDVWPPDSEPRLADQRRFLVGGRSVVILVRR
jgi:glycogen operon protein